MTSPSDFTFVDVLRRRADAHPRRSAFTFLRDGEDPAAVLTYGDLDRRARSLAAHLQAESAVVGERALLLYPAGLDYIAAFFGCLYAGLVPVPTTPPQPRRDAERLRLLTKDTGASFALTTRTLEPRVAAVIGRGSSGPSIRCLITDDLADGAAEAWRELALRPTDLAFLQYTSGSTTSPRGVRVSHASLLENQAMIQAAFGTFEATRVVSWLPLYHDMGLIGAVLHPVYVGGHCALMSPAAFLQRPARWLRAVARHGATISGAPNFAYDLCVDQVSDADKAGLDLSRWEVAFNGAEPVRVETLERFVEAFACCGFQREALYPCYGLAEATLFVAGGERARSPRALTCDAAALERHRLTVAAHGFRGRQRTLVSCGHPWRNQEVLIVEPDSRRRAAPDAVGEIWIRGPAVADGYWDRPAETEAAFDGRLADTGEGPYLRTGDLGVLRDGALFVTGRLKDLVIVRGRNHAPEDIEAHVARSNSLLAPHGGAVFSAEVDGREQLVVVHEVLRHTSASADDLFATIRHILSAEHELRPDHIVLIRHRSLPRTSSGKVRRGECRDRFLAGGLEVVAEWHAARATVDAVARAAFHDTTSLAAAVAACVRIAPDAMDASQPLVRLGLDSLGAIQLAHVVERHLGRPVSPAWLLEGASLGEIEQLARREVRIADAPSADRVGATPAGDEDANVATLSSGERALYFLNQMAPDDPSYHLACAVRVVSPLDVGALRHAVATLARRHPALRTTFEAIDGQPVRRVAPPNDAALDFAMLDVGASDDVALREWITQETSRPFDLARGPLWRFRLLQQDEKPPVFLAVVHHIVADLWSLTVVAEELGACYRAAIDGTEPVLPRLETTPWTHAIREHRRLASAEGMRVATYWEGAFPQPPPALDLPTDLSRSRRRSGRGAHVRLALTSPNTEALHALAERAETTLPAVVMTAFQVVLGRYADQHAVAVGLPMACRPAGTSDLVAYCVNTLPILADLSDDPDFATLLSRMRRILLDTIDHDRFPFERLVERLQPVRDPAQHPLVHVLFVFQQPPRRPELAAVALGEPGIPLRLGPLHLESLAIPVQGAPFDLTLRAAEWERALRLSLEYDAALFEAETAARLLASVESVLREVVRHPERRVSELRLIPEAERRRVVVGWNDTQQPFPRDEPLTDAIAAHAQLTPDAPAVVFGGRQRTYRELDARVYRIAQHLRGLGVAPEVRVGILMERSLELVEAIIGTMTTGGVYVPLDPSHPDERLAFMARDARISVVLTQNALSARAAPLGAPVLACDGPLQRSDARPGRPPVRIVGDNLAYVIYTSGSTGQPKGAMNTHAGLANRILWMQAAYRLGADDCVLQKTPVSFDVSMWEFFLPLVAGARLVMARPGGHQDPRYLADVIEQERVTTVHFVPSMLEAFLQDTDHTRCPSLRRVISSGEALPVDLQDRFLARFHGELHNLYGPTEAAVDVTAWQCLRGDRRQRVPIGRPIANTRIHIVNRAFDPVPVGVAGELLIGGAGLARGYVGRPDLTAESFVPDPLGPPGERLYRTGDRACYRPGGEIDFLGRRDYQIKIRGVRVELDEIERALRRHPGVRAAVLVARSTTAHRHAQGNYRVTERANTSGLSEFRYFLKGGPAREGDPGGNVGEPNRLVAYVVHEPGPTPTAQEWRQFLRTWLPDAMIPHAFVAIEGLPLLANGKVNRRALPAPPRERPQGSAVYEAPRTATEATLARIWAEVLGVDRVGVHDDFFELGGDSLRSLQVRALAQGRGLEITLSQIFENRTLAALAQTVQPAAPVISAPQTQPFCLIDDADRRRLPDGVEDAYPLSRVQAGIIYHLQLQPASPIYHDVFVYRLRARFDEAAFRAAAQDLVDRHPVLRTSFDLARYSVPLQLVWTRQPADVDLLDWRGSSTEERRTAEAGWIAAERRRPVDLGTRTHIRFVVQRLEDDVFQLVLSFFDMILDGWSTAQLMTELIRCYDARIRGVDSSELPPRVRYRDFVAAEREAIASSELRDAWARILAGVDPTRLPRLKRHDALGATALRSVPIDADLSDALVRAARSAGVPLKHVLLAAHVRVLSLLSGSREVITGLETNGRLEQADGERCLGTHINTTPLRIRIGEESWAELARMLFDAERRLLPLRRYPLFDLQKRYGREPLLESAFNFTHFHVFESLAGMSGIEVLGAWGFEATEFVLRAEFNRNPFTGRVQLDLMGHLGELLPEQLEAIGCYYERALRALAADPSTVVARTPLLADHERHRLLVELNTTSSARAPASTLHDWVERQARATPDAVAVESHAERVRYADLVAGANRLAARLRASGVPVDGVVGLCAERSVDMVVAVLGILKAGAACLPLDPAYPPERLAYMAQDARASLILAHPQLAGIFDRGTPVADLAQFLHESPPVPDARELPAVSPENLAYVIYTSGSTGMPKGVTMPHGPLVNLIAWQLDRSTGSGPTRTLQFSPLSFDASFQEMFSTWASGGTLILIGEAERRDPVVLLRHLSEQRVERWFCPFVALKQLAETAVAHGQVPERLQQVLAAGEALEVTPAVAELFSRAQSGAALHNYYGPSETHVVTAFRLPGSPSGWPTLPPIGTPIAGASIHLLDGERELVPVGVAGEVYVGGIAVGRGYIGRPDATAERFAPDPFSAEPGRRLYRTGDLARRRSDGVIEFLGRADRQVKVRGFRIEPGEIESVLHRHPGIRQAVVLARPDERGHRRLVAYVQPMDEAAPPSAAIRAFLRQRLPDYMVPAVIVPIPVIPLTPSGKVDHRALPEPVPQRTDARRPSAAPQSPLEELLAGLFGDVLGTDQVGRDESFFELGGDSLLATQLVSRVSAAIERDVPLRTLFDAPTVAALAEATGRMGHAQAYSLPLTKRDPQEALPLSFAQQRLFVAAQTAAHSRAYSNPAVIDVQGPLDVAILERTLIEIVRRHEALRTVFRIQDGHPSQVVRDETALDFHSLDLRHTTAAEDEIAACVRTEAARPFDLAHGPMFRVTVVRRGEQKHTLIVTLHHIVSDGWSLGVLLRETADLYRAFSTGQPSPLPDLPIQYGDFSIWQRALLQGDNVARLASYWRNALDALPSLSLRTDHPRPATSSFRGARQSFRIGRHEATAIERLSRREGSTLFMTLLAAFQVLLCHETGQRDFGVGTDLAQRTRPELEGLIGFFVNQVVLRTRMAGDPSFTEIVRRVRAATLDAYVHQNLPFDEVVACLNPARQANRSPLFQVKFVLQNAPLPALSIEGLTVRFVDIDPGTAKFDVLVNAWVQDGEVSGHFEYSTDLFEAPTIERLAHQYVALVGDVAQDREATLSMLLRRLDSRQRQDHAALLRRRRADQRDRLRALNTGSGSDLAETP